MMAVLSAATGFRRLALAQGLMSDRLDRPAASSHLPAEADRHARDSLSCADQPHHTTVAEAIQ